MQSNAIKIAVSLGVLCSASATTNQPPTVSVLFQKGITLSIRDMEERARIELMKKGVTNLSVYTCAVNISFRPPEAGAVVLFTAGIGRSYHQVRFNHEGRIIQTYSGTATEYLGTSGEADPAVLRSLKKSGLDVKEGGKK